MASATVFVSLLYRQSQEQTLPIVIANGIPCQRLNLKHLGWGFYGLYTLIVCPHSIPWNSFKVSTMAKSSIFCNTVFGLRHGKFPTEERNWPVTLSYYWSQLHRGGISVYLKWLCEVYVGQDYLFGNGSLYVVKCLLMDWLPLPRFLFSLFFLMVLVSLHSPTRSVRGAIISLHFCHISL